MLRLRGLTVRGLAPFDVDIASGESVAVIGPSGSGKSLILRAIADLDRNDGNASVDSDDRAAMSAPAWRARVGYLAAAPGWWAETVGAHFADRGKAAALIAELGLPADALDWRVDRLSTGEQQRLALARMLVNDPQVLLLDEPTSGLDDDATTTVEALLAARRSAGVAMLVVTHDAAQARRLAERALRLEDGHVREGAP